MSDASVDVLLHLVGEIRREAAEGAKRGSRLQTDLGLTSVEIIDLVVAAEDAFGIALPDQDTGEYLDATVEELAAHVDRLRSGQESAASE